MDNIVNMAEDTIYGLFQQSAVKQSDTIAFNYFNQTWKQLTYHELLVNTKGIASHLIKTGIKKDASEAKNLESVREACARYGVEVVIARLEEMKRLFYWIKG